MHHPDTVPVPVVAVLLPGSVRQLRGKKPSHGIIDISYRSSQLIGFGGNISVTVIGKSSLVSTGIRDADLPSQGIVLIPGGVAAGIGDADRIACPVVFGPGHIAVIVRDGSQKPLRILIVHRTQSPGGLLHQLSVVIIDIGGLHAAAVLRGEHPVAVIVGVGCAHACLVSHGAYIPCTVVGHEGDDTALVRELYEVPFFIILPVDSISVGILLHRQIPFCVIAVAAHTAVFVHNGGDSAVGIDDRLFRDSTGIRDCHRAAGIPVLIGKEHGVPQGIALPHHTPVLIVDIGHKDTQGICLRQYPVAVVIGVGNGVPGGKGQQTQIPIGIISKEGGSFHVITDRHYPACFVVVQIELSAGYRLPNLGEPFPVSQLYIVLLRIRNLRQPSFRIEEIHGSGGQGHAVGIILPFRQDIIRHASRETDIVSVGIGFITVYNDLVSDPSAVKAALQRLSVDKQGTAAGIPIEADLTVVVLQSHLIIAVPAIAHPAGCSRGTGGVGKVKGQSGGSVYGHCSHLVREISCGDIHRVSHKGGNLYHLIQDFVDMRFYRLHADGDAVIILLQGFHKGFRQLIIMLLRVISRIARKGGVIGTEKGLTRIEGLKGQGLSVLHNDRIVDVARVTDDSLHGLFFPLTCIRINISILPVRLREGTDGGRKIVNGVIRGILHLEMDIVFLPDMGLLLRHDGDMDALAGGHREFRIRHEMRRYFLLKGHQGTLKISSQ